jgi:predicted nucleic acid-binding protein
LKKLTLYLDTTVWNFNFSDDAPQYQIATQDFFTKARQGLYDLFVSDAVLVEMRGAPEPRRSKIQALLEEIAPNFLSASPEVKRLADLYIERGALPQKSAMDALHVAHATVHQIDVLVSFNFKHLANIGRRDRIAAINLQEGYKHPLNLLPPMLLPETDNDNN